jgi:ABC-type sugar transport system ATPase subunit
MSEQSETRQPVLQCQGISKFFGGLTALDKVDFSVYAGEVVALLGDNGAGKSTLIKCVSGVYRPDEGKVFFNGRDITYKSPAEVRDLGIETIYQDLALAENLDVGANVFLGKEAKRRFLGVIPVTNDDYMRAEAATVLDRLDIHVPSLKARLLNLSGGQRQAVAIARALYWDAQLLIMDEPTAALGVPEQRKVLALVRSLREHNIPVIIISHTMQDVMEVADRMVVLRRGRKVANVPRSEATVDLLVKHIVGGTEVDENNNSSTEDVDAVSDAEVDV